VTSSNWFNEDYRMKFVSYRNRGSEVEVGILDASSDRVLPIASCWTGAAPAPSDLLAVIAAGPNAALDVSRGTPLALADVTLVAPIPRTRRNVFCIGRNYVEHAAEFHKSGYDASGGDSAQPEAPVFFTKPASSIVGPGALIDPHTGLTSELDYEAELGVIIGRGGRNITRADALGHVWGYTIINDVTARDLQKRHKQWFLGKGLDTFCPMGPWAVTADEVGTGPLEVTCFVNGEERQRASTADLIFDIPAIIESLSAGITLEPGDVIATGTPKGVGIGFDPPRFLASGDVVRISITKLGTLQNTIGGAR
jgi:2-keto-4-pentenoate hydratase/2-oxohepta-3-ene-1,7-dioic acid hydratase in catechol pathway